MCFLPNWCPPRNSSACFLWYSNNHANAWSCFHPGKPCGCQVGGHEICGVPNKHCTFCRSLVTHVSHQNKKQKKTTRQTCWRRIWVNCNLAQELKVHSTVPMVFDSMDPERTDPFQGKHNHVFWPHDIHSGGRCFDPHLALRLVRSLENPYVVQNYLIFVGTL